MVDTLNDTSEPTLKASAMEALKWGSRRIISSYIFDYLTIVAIAGIAGGINYSGTYHRPFSLTDLSISYPYVESQVPTWLLVVLGLVVPAAIITVVCLVFVPGKAASRNATRALVWRRKLWELNTGYMGLGLSLALAFLFTQGMKNLFGKPRPDLLDRCKPDLDNYANYIVADYARAFNPHWVLVSSDICTNPNTRLVADGFRSFPSGHASFSWSGLFYLALFLSSKFAVHIPLPPSRDPSEPTDDHLHNTASPFLLSSVAPRNRAAAPPIFLLLLPLVPICIAIYVTASRYFQYHHFGVDLFAGSVIGILTAWGSFRWYHAPVGRGAGWSWGARTADRAWGIGVGTGGYVGGEGWWGKRRANREDREVGMEMREERRDETTDDGSEVKNGTERKMEDVV